EVSNDENCADGVLRAETPGGLRGGFCAETPGGFRAETPKAVSPTISLESEKAQLLRRLAEIERDEGLGVSAQKPPARELLNVERSNVNVNKNVERSTFNVQKCAGEENDPPASEPRSGFQPKPFTDEQR